MVGEAFARYTFPPLCAPPYSMMQLSRRLCGELCPEKLMPAHQPRVGDDPVKVIGWEAVPCATRIPVGVSPFPTFNSAAATAFTVTPCWIVTFAGVPELEEMVVIPFSS